MVDILILGASGFTGRLVTRYLYNHPQRSSFTFAIGVRSKAKGDALRNSLGLDDSVQVVQVDALKYDEVEAAVKDAKVIISAVGTYWLHGHGIVRACAVHGKRYVDLAGEPHFIRKISSEFDFVASKTGAIIVNVCALASIPADLLVYLSNKTLKNALGPDAQLGLSETYFKGTGSISGGTFRSAMADIEEVPRLRLLESHEDYALSPVHGYPSPKPSLSKRVPFSKPTQYGMFWPIGLTDRQVVQRTFGLNALASMYDHVLLGVEQAKERRASVQPLTYGPEFRYEEYFVVGRSPLLAAVYSAALQFFLALVFFCAPLRWFLKKLIPPPGEGPSDATMAKGWVEVTNFTQCATSPGVWAKSVMRGKGDPGYLLTSVMMSESALALLLDDASLPPSARPGGVLTPATAFGSVLVSRLEATGRMSFESEIVRAGDESRKDR